MKAPSAELTNRIREFVAKHNGKVYAPIPHPAFADIKYQNGPERFDLIVPHLEYKNGTVLDIGSKWGYVAHRLEELGYKVTAVESARLSVYFMSEIRHLCERTFEVVHDSIFNLERLDYDIVFALNIFHHFMKTEQSFEKLDSLLCRLKCRMMIYQAHDPSEPQMAGAYRNMTPEEAAHFMAERLSLPRVVEIGMHQKNPRLTRKIFKLSS